ncbi:hypothetical protein C8R43DRAFT_1202908 [Mycena crocata]|nr:hypothetical protein C8R43DRAFT_1202908 [Mycena crocata]
MGFEFDPRKIRLTMNLLKNIQLAAVALTVTEFPGARAAPFFVDSRDPSWPVVIKCREPEANCVAIGRDKTTDATWAWTWTSSLSVGSTCDKTWLSNGNDNPCLMEKFSLAQHSPPDAGLTLNGCGGALWVNTNGQKFADCTTISSGKDYEDNCGMRTDEKAKAEIGAVVIQLSTTSIGRAADPESRRLILIRMRKDSDLRLCSRQHGVSGVETPRFWSILGLNRRAADFSQMHRLLMNVHPRKNAGQVGRRVEDAVEAAQKPVSKLSNNLAEMR